MMALYEKPYRSFEEQLCVLKERGMLVADDAKALACLSRIGYYRLSAYWHPFRKFTFFKDANTGKIKSQPLDDFVEHLNFQHVIQLYVFDKKLRLLFLDAIERIEVAFRTDIAYLLGRTDRFAHLMPELLDGNFTKKLIDPTGVSSSTRYSEWLQRYDHTRLRSKEDFVQHFQEKYGGRIPIWAAVELWDFDALSNFYADMKFADRTEIANNYGISQAKTLQSWLAA
jgi:abortive infection bacteriophage resistance protein